MFPLWNLLLLSSTETSYVPNLQPNGFFVYKSPCTFENCAGHFACNYVSEENGTYCIFGQVSGYEAANDTVRAGHNWDTGNIQFGFVKGSGDGCPEPIITDPSYFNNLPKDRYTYCNISSCNYTGLESAIGYCYRSDGTQLDYDAGQTYCQSMGANLPSIHSDPKRKLLGGSKALLASYRPTGGALTLFVNADDTPFDYHNWSPGNPDSLSQNCVQINFKNQWDDIECSSPLLTVCKKPIF